MFLSGDNSVVFNTGWWMQNGAGNVHEGKLLGNSPGSRDHKSHSQSKTRLKEDDDEVPQKRIPYDTSGKE
ncbi:hypothetical protein J6590_023079 [Homalodisca vitripennis]|nr:hypothetical protein J6590_023079 [Homalodisca vitripennis]